MSDYQNFEDRHIGPSLSQENEMLSVLGYSDLKKFIADVVPENIVIEKKLI
jgi:glycine dehydrogenase